MSILNNIKCAGAGANTGISECFLDIKNIVGGAIVPNDFELSAAQLASADTIMAALEADVNEDLPADRVYPLPEIVGVTDNTEDPVSQTLGYGDPVIVREGKYNFAYQFVRGGFCVNKALRKFNKKAVKVILWDANGVIYGTITTDKGLAGIPLTQFYARPPKINDGSNVTAYIYQITFSPNYLADDVAFVEVPLSQLQALNGLQNIALSPAAARATNVMKIKAFSGCEGLDLYDEYSTELASSALWNVTLNGANITLTSVVVDANLKAWTITMDATDPDYNVSGPFVVKLAAVSALSAAGVEGYESIPVTIP
jgi:hypothetical protein